LATSRTLLSVADLDPDGVRDLIERAESLKQGETPPHLSGKAIALLFEKPSLRTRVSFDVAMWQLGGHAIYLSPADVGLGKRESVSDVARTLSRYVQAIVARTSSHQTLEFLAEEAGVPVINALSDQEHPCQALGDLLTITEKKGPLPGLKVAFVGDGNNVALSLLLAASLVGMHISIASPPSYSLTSDEVEKAEALARQSGSRISLVTEPREAVQGADVVYTDVWTSMGQEDEAHKRRLAFAQYQVNPHLLAAAKPGALFMHPLPAHHGEEISEGMLDHPQSAVFDQAENRLHIQKAILLRSLSA